MSLWCNWHWSVEIGVGDLSWLGWAARGFVGGPSSALGVGPPEKEISSLQWEPFFSWLCLEVGWLPPIQVKLPVYVLKSRSWEKGFHFFSSVLALVLSRCYCCCSPQTSGEVSALLILNPRLELAPVPRSDPVSPRPLHHAFENVQCPCSSVWLCFSICKYYIPSPNHDNTFSNILEKSFYGSLSAMIPSLALLWTINSVLICAHTTYKYMRHKAFLCVCMYVNS